MMRLLREYGFSLRILAFGVLLSFTDQAPTIPDTDAVCPLTGGWEEFNGSCYYFSTSAESRVSWSTAMDKCKRKGGLDHNATLVSIHNEAENTYIKNRLVADRRSRAWIGLRNLNSSSPLEWADGTPVRYTSWASNEQNNRGDSKLCKDMYIDHNTGKWYGRYCSEILNSKGFVCKAAKNRAQSIPPPSTDTDAVCPLTDGWEEFDGSCYYISTSAESSVNWSTAMETCKVKGGLDHNATLASIHHEAENTYIMNRFIADRRSSAWIGLSKQNGSSPLEWADGTPVQYRQWAPYYRGGSQLCIEMDIDYYPGTWNDRNCSAIVNSRGFVCKAAKSLSKVGNDGVVIRLSIGVMAGVVLGTAAVVFVLDAVSVAVLTKLGFFARHGSSKG